MENPIFCVNFMIAIIMRTPKILLSTKIFLLFNLNLEAFYSSYRDDSLIFCSLIRHLWATAKDFSLLTDSTSMFVTKVIATA